MRLLSLTSSDRLLLTEFPNETKPPPYAILSHTWGKDEVIFDDIQNKRYEGMLGYRKIRFCAEQAKRDGLEYFWVDTCCINKAHLTELSESIVLMFDWYRRAAKCYVYLDDVSYSSKRTHDSDDQLWRLLLKKSRWFTRGWTLQELLAPVSVEFFSEEGRMIGERSKLVPLLSEITSIPGRALQGTPLSDFTASERMRWATARHTTKPEDQAYCLLGIFQISMLTNYGEGREKAMIRLKEEISKSQLNELLSIENLHPKSSSFPLGFDALSSLPSGVDCEEQLRSDRTAFLQSLSFAQMNNRRETIRPAYAKTCSWLLCHSAYMDWLDDQKYPQHNGFLWIKGKPGTGKSTLIKYAFEHSSKSPRNRKLLLSFFFNARGDVLEKSTSGMYRSLLCQLLPKIDISWIYNGTTASDAWDTCQLRECFTCVIGQLQDYSIECYIDALDECDEQEIRDMITHFKALGQSLDGRFHVCLASRYYPTIVIRDGDGIQLLLENNIGHCEDLSSYIRNHLNIGSGRLRDDLEAQVQLKANSVFMWAVLVVDILNDEYRRGSIFNVEKRLNEIPGELSKLFEDILLRDCNRREQLLLCLQWILFAKRPLRVEEFYFAMATGLAEEFTKEWDPKYISVEDMGRYVSDSSKGLAELTKSTSSSVQFIHESVRDFLLKDGGLYKLWPELEKDPQSLSHSQLSKCCRKYLEVDLTQYNPPTEKQEFRAQEVKLFRTAMNRRLPFLGYAADYILYHADEMARKTAANGFLTSFDSRNWIQIYNSLEHRQNYRFTQDAPLLYIFAAQNSSWLIRKLFQIDKTIPCTPDEHYRHPLLVAIAHKCWDATRAILEPSRYPKLEDVLNALEKQENISVGKDICPLHWALRRCCIPLAEMLVVSSLANLSLRTRNGQTALSLAAEKGLEVIVEQLLLRNAADSHTRSALHRAAREGHIKVVKMLLQNSSDVDSQGRQDRNTDALHAASAGGHLDVVRLLLDAGADIDGWGNYYGTALRAALQGHHENIVQLLLDKGGDVDAHGDCDNVLHAALSRQDWELAKLLLDRGAGVNAQGERHNNAFYAALSGYHWDIVHLLQATGVSGSANEQQGIANGYYDIALQFASAEGHRETVNLLLGRGVNINARGGRYGNALYAAVSKGQLDTARLLLSEGADVDSFGHENNSALYAASHEGNQEMVQLLIDNGVNANAKSSGKGSALYAASAKCHRDIVKLLLDHGANVNISGGEYGNALQAASVEGHWEVVKLLLNGGANCNAFGGFFGHALQAASKRGHWRVVQLLLDAGTDVNARPTVAVMEPSPFLQDYQIQLCLLAQQNKKRLLMARRGQDIVPYEPFEVSTASVGAKALVAASAQGHKKVVQLLVEAGVDVNAVVGKFGNALQAALHESHQEIVQLLVEAGANVDAGGGLTMTNDHGIHNVRDDESTP